MMVTNGEYDLYKSPYICSVRISRLRWSGHVKRMEENKILKKVLEYKAEGRRRVGRPRLWWEDCLQRDIQNGVKELVNGSREVNWICSNLNGNF